MKCPSCGHTWQAGQPARVERAKQVCGTCRTELPDLHGLPVGSTAKCRCSYWVVSEQQTFDADLGGQNVSRWTRDGRHQPGLTTFAP